MTETQKAAMQQALECLKGVARGKYDGNAAGVCAALDAALAEPEPELVGWQWLDTGHFRKKIPADSTPAHWRPLYTAPPALQPLTTDQIVKLWNESIANGAVLGLSDTVLFARAIECKITGGNNE